MYVCVHVCACVCVCVCVHVCVCVCVCVCVSECRRTRKPCLGKKSHSHTHTSITTSLPPSLLLSHIFCFLRSRPPSPLPTLPPSVPSTYPTSLHALCLPYLPPSPCLPSLPPTHLLKNQWYLRSRISLPIVGQQRCQGDSKYPTLGVALRLHGSPWPQWNVVIVESDRQFQQRQTSNLGGRETACTVNPLDSQEPHYVLHSLTLYVPRSYE